MQAATAQRLIQLNKEFYQRHAESFSATRGRLQPGVLRVLQGVPTDGSVLDLGCGNGGVAKELQKRGFAGRYVGVDFSAELLDVARSQVHGENFAFIQHDLTNLGTLPFGDKRFDFVFCFASLHHIPSHELRLAFLRQVTQWLAPAGRFPFSVWRFLASERLRERIQPWAAAGLSAGDMDAGDYLLDWRSGGEGLRYVHAFDEAELAKLCDEAGFKLESSFLSDGHGGKLGLYQTWVAKY